MQNWKIVVIGSIKLFIARQNSCTISQLLRSEKINIELTPPLRYHTGNIWARAPWALWYHLGSLELSMHSRHSGIQSTQALKGLGHWSTWGTSALSSANSCTILYAGQIILYNTTRKLHWPYPHTFVFICLSATKTNKKNEGRPKFFQPYSFIYLWSTWRQKICPWRVLRS